VGVAGIAANGKDWGREWGNRGILTSWQQTANRK